MKATSNSSNLLTSMDLPCSSIILSVYFLNSLNISSSFDNYYTYSYDSEEGDEAANFDSFSIRFMKILLISTDVFRLEVVSRSYSRD